MTEIRHPAGPAQGNEPIQLGHESVETAEPHETETRPEKEDTPMLDVHAPHGGVHTWKDFWIHLGTITLGLLIAVGLEQSVEKLHRLNERHQLQADLRQEGLNNQEIIAGDMKNNDSRLNWLLRLRADVDRMRASGGKQKVAYRSWAEMDPKGAALPFIYTSSAVWQTAKESEMVALLDRDQAELYTAVYGELDYARDVGNYLMSVQMERNTFEARFEEGTSPLFNDQLDNNMVRPNLGRMTMQQLDEYSALLTKDYMAQLAARRELGFLGWMNTAMVNGAKTTEQFSASMSEHIRESKGLIPLTPQPRQ
jgi:hypothetical protein